MIFCYCKQQHSCRKCPQQGIANFSILSFHLCSLNYFSSYGRDIVNLTISFPSKSWTLKFLDRYHANLINLTKTNILRLCIAFQNHKRWRAEREMQCQTRPQCTDHRRTERSWERGRAGRLLQWDSKNRIKGIGFHDFRME